MSLHEFSSRLRGKVTPYLLSKVTKTTGGENKFMLLLHSQALFVQYTSYMSISEQRHKEVL